MTRFLIKMNLVQFVLSTSNQNIGGPIYRSVSIMYNCTSFFFIRKSACTSWLVNFKAQFFPLTE